MSDARANQPRRPQRRRPTCPKGGNHQLQRQGSRFICTKCKLSFPIDPGRPSPGG